MGSFGAPTNFGVGASTFSVAVGDFNGDGKPDLAVTNSFGNGSVGVLLGNGAGTFQPVVQYPVSGNPGYLATADFNGDGVADLAIGAGTLSVLLGKGDGTFGTAVSSRASWSRARSGSKSSNHPRWL